MNDIEFYRQALGVVVACFLAVGGALLWVITWNAKRVITSMDDLKAAQQKAIDELRDTLQKEMRSFDRRLVRLETIARLRLEDFDRDEEETRRRAVGD